MDKDFNKLDEWSLRDLQEARHQLRQMLDGQGWQAFLGFVYRDQSVRINDAMQPARTVEAVLASEYSKGVYWGATMPFKALEGWVEELNQAIAAKEPTNADQAP